MRRGGFLGVVIALLIGGLGGIASAHWAIDRAASAASGSWRTWIGNSPYTSAHYLLDGRLPPARGVDLIYEADKDADGRPLAGTCDYALSGSALAARWWRVSTPDSDETVASSGAIGEPDGTVRLVMSNSTKPGNRLAPGDTGQYRLYLTLKADAPRRSGVSVVQLPRIVRGGCR